MTPQLAVMILAAGLSRRMGTNKLLVEVDGQSLIERTVEIGLSAGIGPVIVVVGHEALHIQERIRALPVSIVENAEYELGLSSSISAGLRALEPSVSGVAICLADMPGISAPIIRRLAEAFHGASGSDVVAPIYRGRRGNPVLWGRSWFPELMKLSGDRGGRDLLLQIGSGVAHIDAGTDAIFKDIDTPDDLAEWRQGS